MADIVFIDSGTGGIPYLNYLLKKDSSISCAYVADNKNFPYGEKSHEEIVNAVISLCDKIIKKLCPKIIVIACNTMSVNALDMCREVFPETQFVGTVPAIKVAGEISKKRKIGLLATTSTVNNPYNQDLKNHFAADCELVLRADPDLISFIEHKSFTATEEERKNACIPAVDFFKEKDCDVIILGCTHFLNLADEMQEVSGNEIKVVDSKEGVVNRALCIFKGGVAGGTPAGRGSEQRSVSEGKAFPFNKKSENCGLNGGPSLFVTDFTDKKEYDLICENYKLNFGGIL